MKRDVLGVMLAAMARNEVVRRVDHSKKPIQNRCHYCGKPFQVNNSSKSFCSAECFKNHRGQ